MKLTSAITAVLALGLTLLTASVAFAQSSMRDEVLAELQRSRARAEAAATQSENTASAKPGLSQADATSAKTRTELPAEQRRARAKGEVDGFDGENHGFSQLERIDLSGRVQVLASQGATSGQ